MKKLGFTLAETLITLAIIGVVAALTIPNMIARHQKREIEVGLQKTYSELSNWYKMAQTDFGTFDNWEIRSLNSEFFVGRYVTPYMKINLCKAGATNCFVSVPRTNWYVQTYMPTSTKEPGDIVQRPGTSAYLLPDGRAISFYVEGNSKDGGIASLEICADVNGTKGRSIIGQDVFCFHMNNFRDLLNHPKNTLAAGDLNGNKEQAYLIKKCYEDVNGRNCSILLQRNGWKFPDNYPIKF